MRSSIEVYIEVVVYAILIVFGFDMIISGEDKQKLFGTVMVGISIIKIFLLNHKWNKQRLEDE